MSSNSSQSQQKKQKRDPIPEKQRLTYATRKRSQPSVGKGDQRPKTQYTPEVKRRAIEHQDSVKASDEESELKRDGVSFFARIRNHRINLLYRRAQCDVTGRTSGSGIVGDNRQILLEAAHLLPWEYAKKRDVKDKDKDKKKREANMRMWEFMLGYDHTHTSGHSSLHIDTRLNGMILRVEVHRLLDAGLVMILMPADVTEALAQHIEYNVDPRNSTKRINIPDLLDTEMKCTGHEYCLVGTNIDINETLEVRQAGWPRYDNASIGSDGKIKEMNADDVACRKTRYTVGIKFTSHASPGFVLANFLHQTSMKRFSLSKNWPSIQDAENPPPDDATEIKKMKAAMDTLIQQIEIYKQEILPTYPDGQNQSAKPPHDYTSWPRQYSQLTALIGRGLSPSLVKYMVKGDADTTQTAQLESPIAEKTPKRPRETQEHRGNTQWIRCSCNCCRNRGNECTCDMEAPIPNYPPNSPKSPLPRLEYQGLSSSRNVASSSNDAGWNKSLDSDDPFADETKS
ncbi:hypothetical protein CVT24_005851 [Panaeolus cyanescens]|uniref:HNH nuclease domain-containing protein n=1 Tax=Panaeolus cyanescens TaxID=181874 RepID=A0A409YEZ5_9AGAR|nr:hypothetical protein CVT24_005851 [Panaeolus cyanescens]